MNAEEEAVSETYGSELATLKLNSKPLINSLTMMAEDFMKHAHIVVQTIEKQLLRVRPNVKLPILYLIDSIVKNVKRNYIGLFTQNIVSVFCSVFEKVDEATRTQMFKLRQTWNEVFPTKKLYSIDVRVHQIDSAWPVITPPAPSIHVNPKFLSKGTLLIPGSSTVNSYEFLPSLSAEPVDEATEAQMREQLLIKQKELIDLQQKKLELELMHAKAKLEEQERIKKLQEGAERQQQLMKQAEMAKHQTDIATSIMALAGTKSHPTFKPIIPKTVQPPSPMNADSSHLNKTYANDPRLNRVKEEKSKTPAYIPLEAPKKTKHTEKDDYTNTNTAAPLPKLSVSNSRSSRKNSPMPSDKFKKEISSDSRSPAHSTNSTITEPKEIVKENRKRHIHDVDLFSQEPDSVRHKEKPRHKSSRNIVKEREREKESYSKDKSVKSKEKLNKTNSTSSSESGHRRTKVASEEIPNSIRKESGTSSGSSSISSGSSKPKIVKRDSDEDYEDEMKGYSALTIKPKRNDVNSPSPPLDRKSPSRTPIDPENLSPKSPSKSKEPERTRKVSPPRSSPIPSRSFPNKLPANSSVVNPLVTSSTPATFTSPVHEKKSRSKDKIIGKPDEGRENRNKRGEKLTRETKDRSKGPTKEREGRKVRQEKEKEQYANRKSAVLSRNYRKRQDPSSVILSDDTGNTGNSTDPLLSGDIDLRFEGLQDVDLRRQPDDEAEQQPQAKKPRNSAALIDDLFGQEDVDLRQSSSNWSQVKKPSSSPVSTFSRHDHGREEMVSPSNSVQYDDIRDILREGRVRPPPAISPANSVGSTRSSCDPLGRPLLFARLPDDPEERKRSLDTRSSSIDPVEQFCVRYIDKPSMRVGGLTQSDLNFAYSKSKQEADLGTLTDDQYNAILKRLVQVNELHKIQQLQDTRGSNGPRNGHGPSPWSANPTWQPRQNFGVPRALSLGPNRFSGQGPMQHQQWGGNQWNGGPRPSPRGPNPFMEALARPEDFIPEANPIEVSKAERDIDSSIPLDKIPRQIRFYGETAIVFVGIVGDEPREISFQKGGPAKIVYVNKEPLKCFTGATRMFYIDKIKHTIRIGSPKRELYIDGEGYETCFGGPPISVRFGTQWHSFKLEGPPPQVEVGKEKRYDLVAGRVTLFIDSNSVTVYLDEKAQLLDLCGFPLILKFSDDFHSVTLNGRPFHFIFGGNPMVVTLPGGRQHYLRFADVSPATKEAMHIHVRLKQQQSSEELPATMNDGHFGPGPTFRGRGQMRGRGSRGGPRQPGPGFVPLNAQLNRPEPVERVSRNQDEFSFTETNLPLETNPLDMLATFLPHSSHSRIKSANNQENAYESETSFLEDNDSTNPVDSTTHTSGSAGPPQPLSVEDLLSKLLKAGILHSVAAPKESEAVDETVMSKEEIAIVDEEGKPTDESIPADSTTFPPLETVDLSFKDNMRERRVKLVDQICTGIQCASCGLRFAPDQTFRYTQHLDWHFRQNRREKGNSRKALSRKWYYDLSDWIQFAEMEDLEERAASMFEPLDGDIDGDERNTGTILNPDAYTVLAVGHEGDLCPQCGEEFETFYDEEEEEWRLRDAFLSPESDGEPKLYHPICHQDYTASLQDANMTDPEHLGLGEVVTTIETEVVNLPEEDDDEVLILKEGKKEIVLMEIDVDEDETHSRIVTDKSISENDEMLKNNSQVESSTNVEVIKNNINEIESLPFMASISSRSILSPILIHDDDESNSNIPGIFAASSERNSGVFGFALGLDSSQGQEVAAVEEQQRITYNPWQFDFPKIKTEPPEWEDVDEGQVIMSRDYKVVENQDPEDITLDDDSQQPSEVIGKESLFDIDLTTEEDDVSSTPVGSLVAEIDGNLEFKGDTLTPLVPPTKIRINITGLNVISSSASPNRKGSPVPLSHGENPKDSPTRPTPDSQESTDSGVTTVQSPKNPDPDVSFNLEEMKRLKPRMVGRKFINCPPKMTGKEESGLCVIC